MIVKDTKRQQFLDTIEFRHSYVTQSSLVSKDRIVHAMSILVRVLNEAPTATYNALLDAIADLHDLFS